MADVFLSYKTEDRDLVAILAQALEREGVSVWWDKKLSAGGSWRETITGALDGAKVVIVAWSKRTEDSAAAAWVFNEVDEAQRMKRPIVPVMLEPCVIPLGYRHVQAANLAGWRGDAANPEFREVLDAVRAGIAGKAIGGAVQARPAPRAAAPAPAPEEKSGMGGAIFALVAIAVIGAGGYFAWTKYGAPQAPDASATAETTTAENAETPVLDAQSDNGHESEGLSHNETTVAATGGPQTVDPPPVAPPPMQGQPRVVRFGGGGQELGLLRNEGNGVWGEYRLNGERAFEFRVAQVRPNGDIELRDEGRDLWLYLGFTDDKIHLRIGGDPYREQYLITSVER